MQIACDDTDARNFARSILNPLPTCFRPPPAANRSPAFVRRRTKITAPCARWSLGRETPLTVNFTTVTTGPIGTPQRRLNLDPFTRASRPHRTNCLHPCIRNRIVPPILLDDFFPRLKPHSISGEMTTPSGIGTFDMPSTGIGNDAVFAHAAPASDLCTRLTPDDADPHHVHQARLTIAAQPLPPSIRKGEVLRLPTISLQAFTLPGSELTQRGSTSS